jgi:hypothetical protein
VDLAIAGIVIVAGSQWGESLLRRNRRRLLALVWVLYGALMLALPSLTAWFWSLLFDDQDVAGRLVGAGGPSWIFKPVFAEGWKGWWGPVLLELVPPLAAGAVGAVIACVWVGWYLAVCFAFNGHNNEVGGAARIERFKQFIRFRLTEDGLTGYVIGIDDPRQQGRNLRPRIVDVFHLRVKRTSGGDRGTDESNGDL